VSHSTRAAALAVLALAVAAVSGCSSLFPRVLPPAGVSISNQTTLEVTLLVNGSLVRRVPAGIQIEVPPTELPPQPWNVEARSPSGRLLVQMAVRPGDVDREGDAQTGVGGRVDLSCGRLDIWSGPADAGSGTRWWQAGRLPPVSGASRPTERRAHQAERQRQ
jgi:hypothetical protein